MSDYIKNGVYYAIDAANNELDRMPYAFDVRNDGDNPFADDMPAGIYQCTGWGREAHVNTDYSSATGWSKIPRGQEYYILSGQSEVFATTAAHARENYEFLFAAGGIRRMICSIAQDVFHNAGEDAWGDRAIEEIETEMNMEEASQWDEAAA
tara:strand:+ start:268 stop:723 length:456 start_codon:yes stop_codon:yes gene_type:complete